MLFLCVANLYDDAVYSCIGLLLAVVRHCNAVIESHILSVHIVCRSDCMLLGSHYPFAAAGAMVSAEKSHFPSVAACSVCAVAAADAAASANVDGMFLYPVTADEYCGFCLLLMLATTITTLLLPAVRRVAS